MEPRSRPAGDDMIASEPSTLIATSSSSAALPSPTASLSAPAPPACAAPPPTTPPTAEPAASAAVMTVDSAPSCACLPCDQRDLQAPLYALSNGRRHRSPSLLNSLPGRPQTPRECWQKNFLPTSRHGLCATAVCSTRSLCLRPWRTAPCRTCPPPEQHRAARRADYNAVGFCGELRVGVQDRGDCCRQL